MENKHLSKCRYYHGEEENPFNPSSIRYTFWTIEKIYIVIVLNSEIEQENIGAAFSIDFPDLLEEYDMPVFLKATLYTQYVRFGGSKENFEDWLLEYFRQTP